MPTVCLKARGSHSAYTAVEVCEGQGGEDWLCGDEGQRERWHLNAEINEHEL